MRNRNIITGAFVLAGIALFALVIFLVGNQRKTFAKHVGVLYRVREYRWHHEGFQDTSWGLRRR